MKSNNLTVTRILLMCIFYLRSYADGTQSLNDSNEVFVRTSVGSYRFEGISREFTRKLYDWERYRGISPTSSTFRLLGPGYIPSLRRSTIETSTNSPTSKILIHKSLMEQFSPHDRLNR